MYLLVKIRTAIRATSKRGRVSTLKNKSVKTKTAQDAWSRYKPLLTTIFAAGMTELERMDAQHAAKMETFRIWAEGESQFKQASCAMLN